MRQIVPAFKVGRLELNCYYDHDYYLDIQYGWYKKTIKASKLPGGFVSFATQLRNWIDLILQEEHNGTEETDEA